MKEDGKIFNILPNRHCIQDIGMFDLHSRDWKRIEAKGAHLFSGVMPEERRNHVADLLNHHMIIYGGVDGFNKVLNDVWSLDLVKKEWTPLLTQESASGKIPKLCRGRCAIVLHN
jgi:hypothetical protein